MTPKRYEIDSFEKLLRLATFGMMIKEIKKFAFLPTKLSNGKMIWLKKYKATYEVKESLFYTEDIVSEGLFTEVYRPTYYIGSKLILINKTNL